MAGRRRVKVERVGNVAFPLAELRERPPPPFAWVRTVLAVVLLGGLVIGLGMTGMRALIDLEAIAAETEAALAAATGREVRVRGKVTILSYLGATVAVDDVVVVGAPQDGAPPLLRIGRLEAELSLSGLVSRQVDIQRLVIVEPEVALEIDAQGRGNWQSAAVPGEARPKPPARSLPRFIHLKDGKLSLKDARDGRAMVVGLRRVSASETDASGQMTVAADLVFGTQRASVTGIVGSLARLLDRGASSAWPVRLGLETMGAKLSASGSFTRPLELGGYALKLDASVGDSSMLAALSPVKLPQMRTLVATARIADTGGAMPDIAGVRLQMGASDFSTWVPGLKLDALEVNMPALDQALRGEFLGTLQGVPVRLQVALGAVSSFLPNMAQRPDNVPIDITAEAGESRLTVKGAIAGASTRTGLDLAVTGRVRDLELLAPLVGQRLPALRNLAFEGRLGDGAGGYGEGVAVRGFSLTAPQGDLAGEFTVQFGPQPSLRGALRGASLDADALHLAMAAAVGPVSVVAPGPAFRPRGWDETRVIPEGKLRLDVLREGDVDLSLTLGEMRALGSPYKDVSARLVVEEGRLVLDPLVAELPSGRMSLRFAIDGTDPANPASLRMTVPGLPVQSLLTTFSRRDNLFGTLEVEADLRARGASVRALLGSVSGHLGLAIVEGDIDSRLLLDPLAEVLRAARVPVSLATQLNTLSRLRCLALRLEAEEGKTELAAMAIESGPILIQGDGGFDLGEEAWRLRLRPTLRLASAVVTVPVRLEGSFLTPRLSIDAAEAARAAGAVANPTAVRGLEPEACVPALAAARAGRVGPLPRDIDSRAPIVRPVPRPVR